jgi:hypothetical protein
MVTGVEVGANEEVTGVSTYFGITFRCRAAVLTTGTFMNGQIWVGRQTMSAGRAGEAASTGLTESLVALGFETDRLKTGTPARVDKRTVNFGGAWVGVRRAGGRGEGGGVLECVSTTVQCGVPSTKWPGNACSPCRPGGAARG